MVSLFQSHHVAEGVYRVQVGPLITVPRRLSKEERDGLRSGCVAGQAPIWSRSGALTLGQPMPFWDQDERIEAQPEPPTGPEWVALSGAGYLGRVGVFLAQCERPRLIASGEIVRCGRGLRPTYLHVHRDDLAAIMAKGGGSWVVRTPQVRAAVRLAQQGVLTIRDASDSQLVVGIPAAGLTGDEIAAIGGRSLQPEARSPWLAFPGSPDGHAIAATLAECERAGYLPVKKAILAVAGNGAVYATGVELRDPAAAAAAFNLPWVAHLRPGQVLGHSRTGLAISLSDLPRLHLGDGARVGFDDDAAFIDLDQITRIEGEDPVFPLLRSFVMDTQRVAFAFVSPETAATDFVTTDEANKQWTLPATITRYRLHRLDRPREDISPDEYVRLSDCAASPTHEEAARERRSKMNAVRREVRRVLGSIPDGFDASKHTVEQAQEAVAFRQRVAAGELVLQRDWANAAAAELGVASYRLVDLARTLAVEHTDPLTDERFVYARLTTGRIVREYGAELLTGFGGGVVRLVRRIVADPEARENLLIGMLGE